MTYVSNVSPLPVVLALQNARVYICSSDSHNITTYIKTHVNKVLYFHTIL